MIFNQINFHEEKVGPCYYTIDKMQIAAGHFQSEKYLRRLLSRVEVAYLGRLDLTQEMISLIAELMSDNHRIKKCDFYTTDANEYILVVHSSVKNVYQDVQAFDRKCELILIKHNFKFTLYDIVEGDATEEKPLVIPETWHLHEGVDSMQETLEAFNF